MKMLKVLSVFILLFCLFQSSSLLEAGVLVSGKDSAEDSSALSSGSKASSAPKASVEDYTGESGQINPNQPIPMGEEIYRIVETDLETKDSGNYISTATDVTTYTYVRFEYNKIKILRENKYESNTLDFSVSPEPKTEEKVKTKDLSMPVDDKKQALLETVDGRELIITVVDEDKRITVK
ncbi:hypothetical protein ACFL28_03225 [Candidatus Omnitrophota bacterium]